MEMQYRMKVAIKSAFWAMFLRLITLVGSFIIFGFEPTVICAFVLCVGDTEIIESLIKNR
jgi:uncharacterized membrane protein YhdT